MDGCAFAQMTEVLVTSQTRPAPFIPVVLPSESRPGPLTISCEDKISVPDKDDCRLKESRGSVTQQPLPRYTIGGRNGVA